MTEFHFLRPFWLITFLPLIILFLYLLRKAIAKTAWSKICDSHLLPFLIKTKTDGGRSFALSLLFISAFFMIVSLSGPTWTRLPVPTYQQIEPRVILLNMSDAMFEKDLKPDRLSRAKFKLHDLFLHKDAGQFGLVVYTSEPCVVSPLTDDGQTIDSLLSSLTPDVMPVKGDDLAYALKEAQKLIVQAKFKQGQILVLTAAIPDKDALLTARKLANAGIITSIIPVISKGSSQSNMFQELADAGGGELIAFRDNSKDLDKWLADTKSEDHYEINYENEIPIWRDEGRWFLIPALIFLLPAFRRGFSTRVNS